MELLIVKKFMQEREDLPESVADSPNSCLGFYFKCRFDSSSLQEKIVESTPVEEFSTALLHN